MLKYEVFLDVESTGLNPETDEVLEISIIDEDGIILIDSLVKPDHHTSWEEAQGIHGINPEMVLSAPTLEELSDDIIQAVKDKDVIIYNADFDTAFLGDLLSSSRVIHCCMLSWADYVGDWNDYYGCYRWHKLTSAAHDVRHQWKGETHRALADSLACKAVWSYLTISEEKERVDKIIQEELLERDAEFELRSDVIRVNIISDNWSEYVNEFLNKWWFKYSFKHWSQSLYHSSNSYYDNGSAEDEFALIFFNKSLKSIRLSKQFDTVYEHKKDIPEYLVTTSYFSKAVWYQNELIACACYSGKKLAWPLFDKNEKKRIRALHPLRFYKPTPVGKCLHTKTELRKKGFSQDAIDSLEPFREEKNGFNQDWHYLYSLNNKDIESLLKKYNLKNKVA